MATAKKPRVIRHPGMQAYLEAKKHDSLLLGEVDRHLQLLPSDRDRSVIHPSEMARKDWCPRSTWHRLMGRVEKPEPLTIRPALIFQEGHDIHAKWQSWTRDMGILWGVWLCKVCGSAESGWSNELSMVCPSIVPTLGGERGRHIWDYMEVPLTDRSLMIAGHADGIVNPTGDEPLLLEVKSVGPGTLRELDILGWDEDDELSSTRFSKISRPSPSHFRQVQIYLRLARSEKTIEDRVGQISRAVVIYEHKADQQVREFVVTYDPRWTDELFDVADEITWAIENGREIRCPYYDGCKHCRRFEES